MRIVERYPIGVSIARGGGGWRLLFPLRLALSGLYGTGVSIARVGGAVSKPRPISRLVSGERPFVVSVGNLIAGGSGKTPCVAALAQAIRERGGVPAVVMRGYGGSLEGRGSRAVDGGSDAEIARRFGDEAAIYRSRGIPVVTDAKRRRGSELASDLFSPTHIILDDAFQNRSIEKDLDVLLLDASRPFDGGLLLPAGELREGPGAVRRAGAVIFTRSKEERVPREAERFVAGKPVFFGRHEAAQLIRAGRGVEPLSILAGRDVVLFSGIANPSSFEETVTGLGASVRTSFRYEDHHRYVPRDAEEVIDAAAGRALILTTEKDFVKAGELFPPGAPFLALAIEMKISGLERLCGLIGLGG